MDVLTCRRPDGTQGTFQLGSICQLCDAETARVSLPIRQ